MTGHQIDPLLLQVDINPDGCWIWTGRLDRCGYGAVRFGGRATVAHRVIYEQVVEPVPADLSLDHLCRVPACVNPDHLEPVTHKENVLRGVSPSARNARKTHCDYGHEFTPENTRVKDGRRSCRACDRRRQAECKARKRAAA